MRFGSGIDQLAVDADLVARPTDACFEAPFIQNRSVALLRIRAVEVRSLAVSTASRGRHARLPLPKTPERAILRRTTTGNPGNVGSLYFVT